MSRMEILFDVIFVIATVITMGPVWVWTILRGYTRLCRKGYSPPAAAFVLLNGAGIGAITFYFAILKSAFDQLGSAQFIMIAFWLPTVAAVAGTALIIYLLPRINQRQAGKRQPRWLLSGIGLGLVGIGIAVLVYAHWNGIASSDTYKLFSILAADGGMLIGLGRRAQSAVSIGEVTSRDHRAPVLYLRTFVQERLAFVGGPKSRFGQYASKESLTIAETNDNDIDMNVSIRFEQYFKKSLNAYIGPLIALGNPEDYVPLDGAARDYASDSEWTQMFDQLVTDCSCIIAEIGISSNLAWELEYLRKRGFQRKLFILTQPVRSKASWSSRFLMSAMQAKLIVWNDFASTMNAAGYEIGSDPGVGCVLTFDSDGKMLVLKEGAFAPDEFVEPIRDFLVTKAGYPRESLEPPEVGLEQTAPRAEVVKPRTLWSRVSTAAQVIGFFALVFLIQRGCDSLEEYQEGLRASALESFAVQEKFKFQQGDLTVTDSDLSKTWLIDHSQMNGRIIYAMEGEFNGLHAFLFEYQYEVKSQDGKGNEVVRRIVQSVAAFCCADSSMPLFDLRLSSFMNIMDLSDNQREKRLKLSEDAEFSKQFILLSQDKSSTSSLFSAELCAFLNLNYPRGNWRVEGSGPWVMFYQWDVRVKPEQWNSFLDETSQTARGFFQHMGKEHLK